MSWRTETPARCPIDPDAERSLDRALARAVLPPRPYTDGELREAEARLAARVADRLLRDALRRPERGGEPAGDPPEGEAARRLRVLCRTMIAREGALRHMAAFLGRRVPHEDGARVLGCVLTLAGREDSARFWWQFAAGAGDAAAAHCLYLHHLALGELWEAELWRRQAGSEPAPSGSREGGAGDGDRLTGAAAAVLLYVPDAVRFVDEIELPLPEAGFARRIAELTATVS